MKNLFKLFGMALLLSSMALFTACGDDDDDKKVDVPKDLKATATGLNVDFSWSGNGESYEIKISGEEVVAVKSTSYKKENMEEKNYTWQVRAKKGDKYSDWVSGPPFTVTSELLAPSKLSVKISGLEAEFSWEGNAEEYELETAGETKLLTEASYKRTMEMGNYTWKVRAKRGSEYTDWVDGEDYSILPASPTNLKKERPSNRVAILSWDGNSDSYDVKVKIVKDGNTVDEKTYNDISSAKTYRVENPEYEGIEYKYFWEVRAKKGDFYSNWSEDTVAFYMYEPMPADTKVTVTFNGYTWTAVNVIANLVTINALGQNMDAIDIIAEEVTDGFQTVDFRYPLAEIGETVVIDSNFNGSQINTNYFEKQANKLEGMFLGDWIFVLLGEGIGEYKITFYDEAALKVSGELSVELINFDDYYGSQNPEDPRKQVVKVVFENVKLKDKRK